MKNRKQKTTTMRNKNEKQKKMKMKSKNGKQHANMKSKMNKET